MLETETLEALAVADELRGTLLRLARRLRRESHAFGVTGSQVTLLVRIRDEPGIGVRELADREGISAPSVSAQVRRIERAGLITRTTGEDRRRVGFHVTRRAVRVIDSVKSRRTTWLASRLDMLEPEQLEAIRAAARPLASLLEDA